MPYKRINKTVYKKIGNRMKKVATASSVENANKMIRLLYSRDKKKKSNK
tara:strand:+ start:298 stop:444 length:147 start_codon:yes stop_codon:yes gene_type:complete